MRSTDDLDRAFTHPVNIPNAWTRHSRGYRLFTCQRTRHFRPFCRFRDTRRWQLSLQPSFGFPESGSQMISIICRLSTPCWAFFQDSSGFGLTST